MSVMHFHTRQGKRLATAGALLLPRFNKGDPPTTPTRAPAPRQAWVVLVDPDPEGLVLLHHTVEYSHKVPWHHVASSIGFIAGAALVSVRPRDNRRPPPSAR